ncbi:substrate-binding domain-containing protein [Nocardioides sp. YR527]|uniref:substrate-binding domain-containing protein n=1 Tax=Nocardioides sp. YR527 TaxID=1881028 RepID=UPI000B85F54D
MDPFTSAHVCKADSIRGRTDGQAQTCTCPPSRSSATTVLRLGIDLDEATAALDDLGSTGFAVASYNNDVATALLSAATLRTWRVPEDLALIGMDHTPLGQVTVPPLITISYDRAATARSSTAHVLADLGLRDPENTPRRRSSRSCRAAPPDLTYPAMCQRIQAAWPPSMSRSVPVT